MFDNFWEKEEHKVVSEFLEQGYCIFPIANKEVLDGIKKSIYELSKQVLNDKIANVGMNEFFDHTEKYIPVKELNDFRVKMIQKINSIPNLRPSLYHLAKQQLEWVIGNELSMQRVTNLSIQMPNDDSSLLPLHTDVWSGNSAYEVVLWLPFVDCYKTKSMYVLPYKKTLEVIEEFSQYSKITAEELYQKLKNDFVEIDIPYGCGLLFTHSLLHGNRVNRESTTRWTFNIRFKSLLSPYGTKELGETFIPIKIRPMTRIGHHYHMPKV